MKARTSLPALLAALVALLVAGCGGASDSKDSSGGGSSGSGSSKLALVAYSTPQVVYDEVVPAFEKTPAGKGTTFSQSYGASGEQSRAVEGGLPADVVAFSLAPDVDRLVKADLVASDWDKTRDRRLRLEVRRRVHHAQGQPQGHQDLGRPPQARACEVVTPNPFTSGAAKWNLLAGYGKQGDVGYLQKLIKDHVKVQPKSGREALQTFTSGTGDVLLSYENEAITAQKKGQDVDYTIPDQTILIENPIAVSTKSKSPDEGQGLRRLRAVAARRRRSSRTGATAPCSPHVLARARRAASRRPSGLFTIRDIGGWDKINADLFDPATGSVAKIEQSAGVSTDK